MIFILAEVFVTFLVAVCVLRSYFPELDHSLGIATAFSVVCGLLIEISVQLYRNESDGSWNLEETDYNQTEQPPLILWWTQPFAASLSAAVSRSCYIKTCAFTGDRELFRRSAARKAIAFYGSDTNISDLPLPRKDEEFWALLHEESPKNGPHFTSRHFLSLFNFTSTFSRHSHMPLTTLHLPSLNDITDYKYFVNTNEKNKWRDRTAPVLYIQSNCDTPTNRDAFVEELSQYVKIDSFGSCLRNGELPDNLADPLSFDTEEFFRFASKYKFILAIENAVCEDYITEKLWRSLIVGSVPIYFGSPSIRDWLPNYDSAILIAEFDNVQILATYINELDNDDERYNHYLRHKIDGVISNKFLKNTVKSRRWNRYENIVEEFECQLCAQLHEFESGSQNDVPPVDATHYSCQSPESARLPVKNDDKKGPVTDEWSAIFRSARCEGKAIFELASENEPYTRQRLDQRSHQLLLDNAC